MPGREIVLANNEIYHIINRGISSQPIFIKKKNYSRAINTIIYYQNENLPLKYSHFITLSRKDREKILNQFKLKKDFLVEIIAYCLMPNHFHLLLKQKADHGISKFLADFTNSYTRYFNSKMKRNGPLFQGKFKAVRIETEEQFVHVNRYIHLNPYTSYLVKSFQDLENYPYSSLAEYLGKTNLDLCTKEDIFNYFKDKNQYRKFIFDQANYQRDLEKIKHLTLEN